jgi:hypothetical protein
MGVLQVGSHKRSVTRFNEARVRRLRRRVGGIGAVTRSKERRVAGPSEIGLGFPAGSTFARRFGAAYLS